MKIQINDDAFSDRSLGSTTIEEAVESGEGPENLVDFPEDTKYDKGWERAGGESFMRVGMREGTEEPVFIEKSGNPEVTRDRATELDENGAHVVPTLMLLEDRAAESNRIKGSEYQIFQEWAPDNFREEYNAGNLGDNALRQFAENCAVVDGLGFGIKGGEYMIDEMLTDGENCYIVDFGADLGSSSYESHKELYDSGSEFLEDSEVAGEEEFEKFDNWYESQRQSIDEEYSLGEKKAVA
ncbi:MAG: hypothetical protein H8Z69_01040 [Nanohaloarchaea archaeon]|nr:hypothetical protein [Candidatus Nanohaloarchaea archaeon]